MIDKILVEKKLRRIEEFLRELQQVEIDSIEDYRGNIINKRFIERNIELSIEQMIDICRHIVSGLDLSEPETYADCFDNIAKQGIISAGNIQTYKSMIRFRNMLIHIYDGVDDSITYDIYKSHLDDFRLFIEEIRNYLKKD